MRYLDKKLLWVSVVILLSGFLVGCSAEAKKNRHAKRADNYFAQGDYSKAEVEYFSVLRLDQTNAHAIRQLGMLYSDSGRTLRAVPFLVKASQQNTNDVELRLKLAAINLGLGDFKEARSIATNILQRFPKDNTAPILLAETSRNADEVKVNRQRLESIVQQSGETAALDVALATLLIRENNFNDADTILRRAIKTDSKFVPAHQILGTLCWAKSNLVEAATELKTAADLSPARAPQKINYAQFLIQTGKVDEGKKLLTDMTASVPDYLPAWLKLAQIALSEKQLPEAQKYINETLARDPDYFDAVLMNAQLQFANKELDKKAMADLERFATVYSKSPPAHYYLGLGYAKQNDTTKALAELGEAIKLNPNYDDAILQQAQLNIQLNNASAAVATLTPLIKRRPDYAPAYLTLATAQLSKGNVDDALALYRQMEKQFPTNSEIPMLTGYVLQRQGKNADARASFQKSTALAPDALQPVELLVNLDISEKKFSNAQALVEQRIAKQPKSPELQALLGKVFLAQQQFDSAEQAFRKALEFKPDFAPAHRFLYDVYAQSKKYPAAIEELQKVLKENPTDQESLLQLGLIQTELKAYSDAAAAYEKILAVNPRASIIFNNLAYLYSDHLNQLDKAYDNARKARELLPTDPATADTLGWILYKRGEYSWALNLLQESSRKLTTEPDVFFHLGMTQYMLGQEDAAKDNLQRALLLNKEFSGKDDATKRLEVLAMDRNASDPETAAKLEKLLSERPDDTIVLGRLAALYERNKDTSKAVKLYERAVEQNPKNLTATIKLAQFYSKDSTDPKKAMQMAKAARALAPDDPQIAHTLGRLAFESGDAVWSLSLLQESQRKLPKDSTVLYDLAYTFCGLGRLAEAESTMQSALDAAPTSAQAPAAQQFLKMLSICRAPEKAISSRADVETALKKTPNDLPTLAALAALQEQMGQVPAATESYEQILRQYPSYAVAEKRLAILQASTDTQKAYDHALKARAAFPNDAEVTKTLGILTYNRKDYTRAAQLLKESTTKTPKDPESFFYLGMTQLQLKQQTDAQKSLRQALALNLNPKLAQEATKALNPPK